jgi:succinate-acetate transporter protein
MELKWALAIGFEAAFWLMLAAFLVLRYRYEVEGITRVFAVGVVLDTLGILTLGVWDYLESDTVSSYTVFIVAIILYSLTAGRDDLRKLDRWVARRIRPRRRVTC